MAITFGNAKLYVARLLGADSSDTDRLSAAGDAIAAAIEEWNLRHDWQFLLMDTSNGFTVSACTSNGANPSVITTSTALGFAGVNVGQTATGLSGTATVASVDSQTQFTATTQVTGGPVTLTFSADIPVRATVDTYNLPSPFKRAYSARLSTNPRTLLWKDPRWIDRAFFDQTPNQVPNFYNAFNTKSFQASGTGAGQGQNGVVRLFPIPGVTDTLRVRYYRPIAQPVADGDFLDLLDRYVYAFLELAGYYFLRGHDSDNPRTGEAKERSDFLLHKAISDDEIRSEDNDMCLIPQIEHGGQYQVDPNQIIWPGF